MGLLGPRNHPSHGTARGAKRARKANDVGDYPSAIATFFHEKRDHVDHDQGRSGGLDGFICMPSPTPLFLAFILALLDDPVVEFG